MVGLFCTRRDSCPSADLRAVGVCSCWLEKSVKTKPSSLFMRCCVCNHTECVFCVVVRNNVVVLVFTVNVKICGSGVFASGKCACSNFAFESLFNQMYILRIVGNKLESIDPLCVLQIVMSSCWIYKCRTRHGVSGDPFDKVPLFHCRICFLSICTPSTINPANWQCLV